MFCLPCFVALSCLFVSKTKKYKTGAICQYRNVRNLFCECLGNREYDCSVKTLYLPYINQKTKIVLHPNLPYILFVSNKQIIVKNSVNWRKVQWANWLESSKPSLKLGLGTKTNICFAVAHPYKSIIYVACTSDKHHWTIYVLDFLNQYKISKFSFDSSIHGNKLHTMQLNYNHSVLVFLLEKRYGPDNM